MSGGFRGFDSLSWHFKGDYFIPLLTLLLAHRCILYETHSGFCSISWCRRARDVLLIKQRILYNRQERVFGAINFRISCLQMKNWAKVKFCQRRIIKKNNIVGNHSSSDFRLSIQWAKNSSRSITNYFSESLNIIFISSFHCLQFQQYFLSIYFFDDPEYLLSWCFFFLKRNFFE